MNRQHKRQLAQIARWRKRAEGRNAERIRNLHNVTNAEYAQILRDRAFSEMIATRK